MREEEKYMQTSSSCKQDHMYFNVFSGTTPIYHVAILQKSSAYFCKSEIEKKKNQVLMKRSRTLWSLPSMSLACLLSMENL